MSRRSWGRLARKSRAEGADVAEIVAVMGSARKARAKGADVAEIVGRWRGGLGTARPPVAWRADSHIDALPHHTLDS